MPKDKAYNARGRGSYAPRACNICRSKKIKCDGVKPICKSCGDSGRDSECSWGRDVLVRRPRTEAHFEALRKRADALQAYTDHLETILAQCGCSRRLPEDDRGRDSGDSDADFLNSDDEITQDLCGPAALLQDNYRLGGMVPVEFLPRSTEEAKRIATREHPSLLGSYTLFVDGAQSSGYDPTFDWGRYLPPEVTLSRQEHDKILDLTFKFFPIFSLRLVPDMFLRDMHRALSVPRPQNPPRTPNYSPMLHNAILSIASIFADDPGIRNPNSRRHFITAASSHLAAECLAPELSLVHALVLMAIYYANEGEHITAELFCGMSVRISKSLGLELDSSVLVESGLITNEERLARNWTYWAVVSVDLGFALYFGRDIGGAARDAPLPVVDVEQFDQVPWYYAPANIPPQPDFTSCIFAASASLLLLARKIVSLVNGQRISAQQDTIRNSKVITEIDLDLNTWKGRLPPEHDITYSNRAKSTPQRLMLHCMYWWCFIILHRPFCSRRSRPIYASDSTLDHVKLCKRAADNIMELLETWSSLHTLRYTNPILSQIIFSAGSVYVLLALHATSSSRIARQALKSSISQAELCTRYLSEMGSSWSGAARTGDILRGLIEDRLAPIIARRQKFSSQRAPASGVAYENQSSPALAAVRPQAARERNGENPLSNQPVHLDMTTVHTVPLQSDPRAGFGWDQSLSRVQREDGADHYQIVYDFFYRNVPEGNFLDERTESGSFSSGEDGNEMDISALGPETLGSFEPPTCPWDEGTCPSDLSRRLLSWS